MYSKRDLEHIRNLLGEEVGEYLEDIAQNPQETENLKSSLVKRIEFIVDAATRGMNDMGITIETALGKPPLSEEKRRKLLNEVYTPGYRHSRCRCHRRVAD